ncbi:MAG: dihydrolipoamide acetyltransferase family protein [Gemmatimonadota bacterium]
MATNVVMEALSPTMEEGRLVEWKKQEGEPVKAGDVLAEVETDKAVMELVARTDGTLLKHLVPAGTTVPVSAPVAVIGQPGEEVPVGGAVAPAAAAPARARERGQNGQGRTAPAAVASAPAPAGATSDRLRASPLARRIAAEQGIDLRTVAGSGPEGRIIKRDLETGRAAAPRPAAAAPAGTGGSTLVPLTQLRKTIARRLSQSLGPIPTFYLTTEVDMDAAWAARAALNDAAGEGAPRFSFNDLVIKATAMALLRHPACNAWWQDDGIRQWHEVHIGMAVALPDGLITPVIRNAHLKSLREIAVETRDLAARARERKLAPEEYTGSTFSISNLGMLDIDEFTALINPPEAGILAVGRIVEQPVVKAGAVTVGRRMRITMSCDHRVIDGATGAQFLRTLKQMLEQPLAMVW